jgi:hypothetical protein
MPIKQCSNGKWKIGTFDCIYDTKQKATEVWVAILAGGKFAGMKVSYDYDGVLSTDAGKEKAKRDIEAGNVVYIISARDSVDGMLGVAEALGISKGRVYATGSNKAKVEKIKELGIEIHNDNNPDVIDAINALPTARGTKFN